MPLLLDQPLVIEVHGADAGKILHNLTTNEVLPLVVGQSTESFITDLRGWVVAHGLVYRAGQERWLVLGQHPESTKVAAHIDRYIIREKASVSDHSAVSSLTLTLDNASPSIKAATIQDVQPAQQPEKLEISPRIPNVVAQESDNGTSITEAAVQIPWQALGPGAQIVWRKHSNQSHSLASCDNDRAEWERIRIASFWPRMGVDIWEKCIPQELDRDAQAISFTKGCYLGQETIARLDARGQIQKKLCLVELTGLIQLPAGANFDEKLFAAEQEVGRLTAQTVLHGKFVSLAVIRRGFFELNSKLESSLGTARVISLDQAKSYLLQYLDGKQSGFHEQAD